MLRGGQVGENFGEEILSVKKTEKRSKEQCFAEFRVGRSLITLKSRCEPPEVEEPAPEAS